MAKTVFLMEFREQFVKQFQNAVEGSGFKLLGVASEGGELLEKIKALPEAPEIVVVSLMTDAGMDGVATVKALAKNKKPIKVILSYTIDSKMRLVEGLKAGAVDRMRKPFDAKEVDKKLTKVHLMKAGQGGGFFRDSIRLSKPLPVTFSKNSFLAKKQNGRTLDISNDGCRLQSNVPIEKKMEIKIWLELPKEKKPIKVIGRVANVQHNKLHSTYEAGVEFIQIDEKEKEILNMYIMDEAEKI